MKKRILFVLTILVLVGGFLRLYSITEDPPGLYIDEVSIGLNAYDILTTGKDQYGTPYPAVFRSLGDYKMPVYIYAVAVSMAVFGKNEFAIRFPSALSGTLTIVVIFFLVRSLLISYEKTKKHAEILALCTTGLLAITPWHIHFSRGGFEVTLAAYIYFIGLFFAILFWQKKKIRYIVIPAILFPLAMYTYQTYRIFIPINFLAGAILALHSKAHRKGLCIGLLIAGVLSIPLLLFTFSPQGTFRLAQTAAFGQTRTFSGMTRIVASAFLIAQNYVSFFSVTYLFRFGDQINRHQVNNLGILYVWQLPFILTGFYFLYKTKNMLLRIITLFLLLVGPIPASIVVPSPHTLRFLIGSVVYSLLTILGVYQLVLQKGKWIRYGLLGIAVFAVIEFAYYLQYYYVNYPKEALIDWGGSCKEVAMDIQKEYPRYQHIIIDKNLDCIPETFLFYIPHIPFTVVNVDWVKPSTWRKTLYVRPYYGNSYPQGLLYNVYLQDVNHTFFAQFFSL